MLMQKVFGTGGIHFLLPGMIALFLLSFCGAGEKDKILSFNDYSHRQKKIVVGENYLYWVHDFVF
jgi:hypothetical protein